MARRVAWENFTTQTEIFMKESGSTIKQTAKAPTHMPTEPSISVVGKTTSKMAMAWNLGLIVQYTTGCMRRGINTGLGSWRLLMARFTKGSFTKMRSREKGFMFGMTVKNMMENG